MATTQQTLETQEVLEQALQLPQEDQLAVARTLLKSVGAETTRVKTAEGTFSQRWRGKFVAVEQAGDRFKALSQRYL